MQSSGPRPHHRPQGLSSMAMLALLLAVTALAGCVPEEVVPADYRATVYPASTNYPTLDIQAKSAMRESAMPVAGGELSLDSCQTLALTNNEAVAMASEGVRLAQIQVDTAWSALIPVVVLGGEMSWRHNNMATEVNTGSGTTEMKTADRDQWGASLMVQYPILTFGRVYNRLEQSYLMRDGAAVDERQARQRIVFAVTQAYYGILELEATLGVLDRSIEAITAQRDNAQTFLDAGLVTRNEVLVAEVALQQRQQQRRETATALAQARWQLNALMGLDPMQDVEVQAVTDAPAFPVDLQETVALALANRPEVTRARIEAEVLREGSEVARSERWPLLTGYASWTEASESRLVHDGWLTLGAQMQWTLYSGLTEGAIDAAEAMEAIQALQISQLERSVIVEAGAAHRRLTDAYDRLAVARTQVEQARLNLDILETRYRAGSEGQPALGGLVTSAEVVAAEALLADAERQEASARYGILRAWSEVELATGVSFRAAMQQPN